MKILECPFGLWPGYRSMTCGGRKYELVKKIKINHVLILHLTGNILKKNNTDQADMNIYNFDNKILIYKCL